MFPDFDAISHFHLLRPWFALLIPAWAALVVLQRRSRATDEMFGGIIAPHLLQHLRIKPGSARIVNPRNAATVFALLLLIVLMGPSWRQQSSPLHKDETALVILLDLSASMEQADIQPSRVQRSKQKIADLLAIRPGKQAALIAYAGSAHTVLSLTTDADILNQYLSATTAPIMPRPGKFPEYALENIEQVLSENAAPATIVLFTDGLGANSEPAIATFFEEQKHQLLIVGVGTRNQSAGGIPLEKSRLQSLANKSNGHYLDVSIDDGDIRRINRHINSHYVILEDSALPWHDGGYMLLYPAMLLFLLWFRRGWTLTRPTLALSAMAVQLALLFQLTLTSSDTIAGALDDDMNTPGSEQQTAQQSVGKWFVNLWLTPDQQGRLLFQLERYEEAATIFDDPLWRGLSYYYAENFMLAAEYFSRSDTPEALFNEANARAHARDYVRSVARYNALIDRAPDYPGATENRQKVQALIDEINRLSESQQQEAGVSSEEKQRDSSDSIPAEGTDEINWKKQQKTQLTAAQLMAEPELTQMWLRGVTHDPASFLAAKFSMQLNKRSVPERSDQ